jgi:trimethylamine--corrinoid protein Co-methyltransferase
VTSIRANDRTFLSAQFQRLSDEQCQKIHWASLDVMARTGVRVYEQEAIDLLKKAGASVSDGNRVYIPSGLVEKAFTTVPKRVVLCDRYGNRVMPVEGHRSFFGPGSDCLNIIDHRTGERRQPVLQDIVEGMIVADALPHVDFVMSMVLPVDVPQAVADRYQMEAMLNYTTKPIVFVTTEFSGCADAVEMAEAVAGGGRCATAESVCGLLHQRDHRPAPQRGGAAETALSGRQRVACAVYPGGA